MGNQLLCCIIKSRHSERDAAEMDAPGGADTRCYQQTHAHGKCAPQYAHRAQRPPFGVHTAGPGGAAYVAVGANGRDSRTSMEQGANCAGAAWAAGRGGDASRVYVASGGRFGPGGSSGREHEGTRGGRDFMAGASMDQYRVGSAQARGLDGAGEEDELGPMGAPSGWSAASGSGAEDEAIPVQHIGDREFDTAEQDPSDNARLEAIFLVKAANEMRRSTTRPHSPPPSSLSSHAPLQPIHILLIQFLPGFLKHFCFQVNLMSTFEQKQNIENFASSFANPRKSNKNGKNQFCIVIFLCKMYKFYLGLLQNIEGSSILI